MSGQKSSIPTLQPNCDTVSLVKPTANGPIGKFNMDEIMNCMHCGFCLPACPTYKLTGRETQSPRGRIALMKGAALGQLELDAEFDKNMNDCLGCRACETACPAGVQYGSLIETAREVVEDRKQEQQPIPFVKKLVFRSLFPHPGRMKTLGTLLWSAQALGLQKLATKTGLIRILPRPMAEMQASVKTVASPFARRRRARVMPAEGKKTLRVGFFTGCIMDVMFFETNQATAHLLTKSGCEVVFVEQQACCGALHAHSGMMDGAKELAKRNIEAFEREQIDLIVNNAGGCGAALKEYDHWFQHDPEWRERAAAFTAKMRDANELLAELPKLTFTKQVNAVVTYQDSCHLANGQGVRRQPRDLLKQLPGATFVSTPAWMR